MERENIFFAQEKKNGEGKGGIYLKRDFFCGGEDRGRSKKSVFFLEIFLIKGGGSRFPKRQKMFFCQKKTTRSVSRGGHRFRKFS